MRVRMIQKIREKRGETLLELTISIALFGLMALMVATMFGMANRSSMRNLNTDEVLNQAITDIVKEQNLEDSSTVSQTVVFGKSGGGEVSHTVERIKAGGLYKFRE